MYAIAPRSPSSPGFALPWGPGRRGRGAFSRLAQCAGAALLALAFSPFAGAQQWPDKTVRLVAPYPPGGQTDLVSRFLADRLGPVLGQPVIVENKAGAQGIVGLEAVKNSPPDGYTFVYANVSNISINPHVHAKLPYDGLRDFVPVTQIGLSVLAMVVPAGLGPKTLPEFIAYAKANSGKVSFASFGAGSTSHIYGEMLKGSAGLNMTHVPYKGAGPATQDVVAGHAQMAIQDFAAVGPFVRSGRLIALAVTGPKRWPAFPDLQTFSEQGHPLDIAGWNGIMAPANTPKAIVERMSAAINKIIQSPDGRERMLQMGLLATGTTPDEFAEVIRRDTPRWGEVIRKAGIKPE
ncbi:MAG: tripartite tricarboxylate transporter substrate binding protein [Betaproteobacteria bacterium]